MKTVIYRTKNQNCYELLTENSLHTKTVLATMTLFEGTGLWVVTDVRLHPTITPGKYSGELRADDIKASFEVENEEEALKLSKLLREYVREGNTFYWCTYRGLVKGPINQTTMFTPRMGPGFFSLSQAKEKLREIQQQWLGHAGILHKIDNANIQPTEGEVFAKLRAARY